MSNISRPNNFQSLDAKEWAWICAEVKKDFAEKLTIAELTEIITNGVKGNYNKTQFVVNAFTIYKWIEKFIQDRNIKSVKEVKHNEVFGEV